MLQRKFVAFLALAVALALVSCERRAASISPSTEPVDSIVSLSPAATDLLLAIGLADRIVGVSTFDSDPHVASVPRVGDYENVDWERIATLAPKHMIVQMAPERLPSGFVERAKKLGIALHNTHIDRLEDIRRTTTELGGALAAADSAQQQSARMEKAFADVARRVAGQKQVRTLIVISDDGFGIAGRGTYLDDLLIAAGGENVLDASKGAWVKLDREAILALSPDAIVQLVPAPTAAQRVMIDSNPMMFAETPAVKNHRVLVIDDAWALMPGSHVSELASRIADFLHPVTNH